MNKIRVSDFVDILKLLGLIYFANLILDKADSFFGVKNDEKEEERKAKEDKVIKNELDKYSNVAPATYDNSQYQAFADEIQIACFDVGTDTKTIYRVFRKLRNNTDYLKLYMAWGRRIVYDWGIGREMSLPQILHWEMTDTEIGYVNRILEDKRYRNIKYRI
jgi:hypothetical protein